MNRRPVVIAGISLIAIWLLTYYAWMYSVSKIRLVIIKDALQVQFHHVIVQTYITYAILSTIVFIALTAGAVLIIYWQRLDEKEHAERKIRDSIRQEELKAINDRANARKEIKASLEKQIFFLTEILKIKDIGTDAKKATQNKLAELIKLN